MTSSATLRGVLVLLLLVIGLTSGEEPSYSACKPHIDATLKNLQNEDLKKEETEEKKDLSKEPKSTLDDEEQKPKKKKKDSKPVTSEEKVTSTKKESKHKLEEKPNKKMKVHSEEIKKPAEESTKVKKSSKLESNKDKSKVVIPKCIVVKENEKPKKAALRTEVYIPPARESLFNRMIYAAFGGKNKEKRDKKWSKPWQTHQEHKKVVTEKKKVNTSSGFIGQAINKFVSIVFGDISGKTDPKWAKPWQTHDDHGQIQPEVKRKSINTSSGFIGQAINKFVSIVFGNVSGKTDRKWAKPWQTHDDHGQIQPEVKRKSKDTSSGFIGQAINKFVSIFFGNASGKTEAKWAKPWQTHREHKSNPAVSVEKTKVVTKSGFIGQTINKFVEFFFGNISGKTDPKWAKPWPTHDEHRGDKKVVEVKKRAVNTTSGFIGQTINKIVEVVFGNISGKTDAKWAKPWQTHKEHRQIKPVANQKVKAIDTSSGFFGGLVNSGVNFLFGDISGKTDPKWAKPWQTHEEHEQMPNTKQRAKRAVEKSAKSSEFSIFDKVIGVIFGSLPSVRDEKWAEPWQNHKKEVEVSKVIKEKKIKQGEGIFNKAIKLFFGVSGSSKTNSKWNKPWQEHEKEDAPQKITFKIEPKAQSKPDVSEEILKKEIAEKVESKLPTAGVVGNVNSKQKVVDDDQDDDDQDGNDQYDDDQDEDDQEEEDQDDDDQDEDDQDEDDQDEDDQDDDDQDDDDQEDDDDQKDDDKEDDNDQDDDDNQEDDDQDDDDDQEDGNDDDQEDDDDQDDDQEDDDDGDRKERKSTPLSVRSRKHIESILGLDESSRDATKRANPISESSLKDLRNIYLSSVKPLEDTYKYNDISNRHMSDSEIFAQPLVLLLGPYSTGKSSFLNYLMGIEFSKRAIRTGADPSHSIFRIIKHGFEDQELDGTDLSADDNFRSLQKFGQNFVDQLRGSQLNVPLLKKVTFVEAPGILEMRRSEERLYPFNDVLQWFIDRADLILVMFDYTKLDAGYELEAALDQLKGRESQVRILLNKADQIPPHELTKVQGSLFWNLSPLLGASAPPTVYAGSFSSRPYKTSSPAKLFKAQENALLTDLAKAINNRVDNRIAESRRHAVRVRNHARMVDMYLSTFTNNKGLLTSKHKLAEHIVENPHLYNIYEGMSLATNVSRYDLPDPEVYRDFFRVHNLYDFPSLQSTCSYLSGCPMDKLDRTIDTDLPDLLAKYRRLVNKAINK